MNRVHLPPTGMAPSSGMATSPTQLEAEAADVRTPRIRNTLDVLHVLQHKSPVTQHELVADTRLSRGTVASVVRRLLAQELIEMASLRNGSIGPEGGRPAQQISLRRDAAAALSIDIGLRHVCVALGDLSGVTTTPAFGDVDVAGNAPLALETAVTLVHEVMADRKPEELIGVCIGLPAAIDRQRGQIASTLGLTSWTGIRPADELRYRLGPAWERIPFVLENDANLVALSEYEYGAAQAVGSGCQDVVLVIKWSDGIGGALLINGELVIGHRGLAVELGHTPLPFPPLPVSGDKVCERCGHACLESFAGGDALAKALSEATTEPLAFGEIIRRAVEGPSPERIALQEAATRIGEVLGAYVSLLNPRLIVISGRHFGDPPEDIAAYRVIADPLREGMRKTGFPPALEDVDIALGQKSALAAAEGGIASALRRALPRYLESRLETTMA